MGVSMGWVWMGVRGFGGVDREGVNGAVVT